MILMNLRIPLDLKQKKGTDNTYLCEREWVRLSGGLPWVES